jgi:hypothetical protein
MARRRARQILTQTICKATSYLLIIMIGTGRPWNCHEQTAGTRGEESSVLG